jgi:hypothetical protein
MVIVTLVAPVTAGTVTFCCGVEKNRLFHHMYHGAMPLTSAIPPILSTIYPFAFPLLNVSVSANAWV